MLLHFEMITSRCKTSPFFAIVIPLPKIEKLPKFVSESPFFNVWKLPPYFPKLIMLVQLFNQIGVKEECSSSFQTHFLIITGNVFVLSWNCLCC